MGIEGEFGVFLVRGEEAHAISAYVRGDLASVVRGDKMSLEDYIAEAEAEANTTCTAQGLFVGCLPVTLMQLREFSDANAKEFADFIRERYGLVERDSPAQPHDYIKHL